LSLTGKTKRFGYLPTVVVVYLPAFVFSIVDLTTNLVLGEPEKLAWGWAYGVSEYILVPALAFFWTVGMGVVSLYVCWRYYRSATERQAKRNAGYVLCGLALPLIALLLVDGLLPEFEIRSPELASVALAIGGSYIAYGVIRHNLFALTPETAADSIIATMSDALLLVDNEGRVVMANQAALDLLGYDYAELVHRQLSDLFNMDGETGHEDSEQKHPARRFGESDEVTITAKDGWLVSLSVSTSPVRDAWGVKLGEVYVCRDITEQRMVQEALRESEERLRLLVDNAPEAITAYDFNGCITDCNRRAEILVGYSRDELIGRSVFELGVIPEGYVPRTVKALAKANEGVETVPFEFELVRKDGSQITVEAKTIAVERASQQEVICIAKDITDRKHMEEDLLLKEMAMENAVSAIAMSDMEGNVTYLNRACMKLWGDGNKDEILGKPYWKLLKSVEGVEAIAEAMLEKKHWEGELVARKRDGQEIQIQVNASIVEDDQGNPIQTISSFMDITEHKQAEEEKNRMEQQLQLAGRLAAVGELAAGVAHELNNPLAAVQAFAQYLVDKKDLDEDTRGDVQTIYRESQRAGRITNNLLSFARRHRPERSMISINEVVQKSLELHSYRMRVNQIEVVEKLDSELPMTMADYHQLEQVFVNLIANSEQAMTEAHGKGILQISTCVADDMLRIVFTDNGPGIPEDNLKQIFDPFFTTKEVGKGTGLGLSICFGIVQEHGGRMYAESTPGQGATFTVELPILSEHQVLEVDKHTS
jgi:two-component system NtrC family sensor kinase